MDKSRQKTILLAGLGLLIAVLLGTAGWLVIKVLTRPGPRQAEQARLEAQQKALTPKQKKFEEMKERFEELVRKAEALPPFEPPDDEIISPEQMRKYADVLESYVNAYKEEKRSIPKGKKSISEGILIAQKILLVVQGAKAIKQLEYLMSEAEYSWIENNIHDAEIIALLRLEKLTKDPEARKIVREYAERLAITRGYSVTDEKGEFIGKPETLDPDTVPPRHVRYVLEYHKQLGFNPVWIDRLDWTPLLEAEGMQVQ